MINILLHIVTFYLAHTKYVLYNVSIEYDTHIEYIQSTITAKNVI